MTTPEQRLFAAQHVYPDGKWAIEGEPGHENVISISDPLADLLAETYIDFDPENNAEQWRNMWRWVVRHEDFVKIDVNKSGILIRTKNKLVFMESDTEALILAVCALGGFEA